MARARERRSNFMRSTTLMTDEDVVMNEPTHVTSWSPQSSLEVEAIAQLTPLPEPEPEPEPVPQPK